MAILTKFLQLLKPEKNDYVDVEKHLSENYDKIDAKMEELSNSNDEKLDKGNVPDVLNSAEKIIKALQGNTGIKFDENLLYLNDVGTKKKGLCYLDKLTDGIFECIQETTTTVNNATYFKNFSNKENSDRLSNLESLFITSFSPHEFKNIVCPHNGLYILYLWNGLQTYTGIHFISLIGKRTNKVDISEYPGVVIKCSTTANNFSIQAGEHHLTCVLYKLENATPMKNVWIAY